jgi:hypothetical protein
MYKNISKMKKNKLIYIAVIACLLGTISCKKDFLDRSPETAITDAEFWKTSNDLRLYANNWYTAFPTYQGFGTIGIYGLDADQGSDNMITMSYSTQLNGENIVPASGSWGWGSVRNVNYFLNNYTRSTESFNLIRPYVGEAYFFRSLFYYDLLKAFGDLPWITKPLVPDSPELFDGRLPRNVIVDSLMSNLDKAVEYLPTRSSAQASRVNKQIAQLLQARIALFEGTWEKYHAGTPFGVAGSNGEKFLQKAAQVTDALIANSDGYALEDLANNASNNNMGYWGLFNRSNYSSSSEVMLWRQFDLVQTGGHNWNRYSYLGAGRGLTKDLVDAYLCTDGNPISTSPLYKGDATLLDVVANRDPRLAQTIYVNDNNHYSISGGQVDIFTVPAFHRETEVRSATGYQLYKGHNPDFSQHQPNTGTNSVIYYRFAEALLINAEAKAELGTITQADLDKTINKLKARVGMPSLNLSEIPVDTKREFPNLSAIINEVRRERRVELAAEGFRREDLYRWAAMGLKIRDWKPKGAKRAQWEGIVASNVLDAFPVDSEGYIELFKNVSSMANGYQFKPERNYLFPLSTDQLLLNPALKQNPGWE